jgi:heme/copper-type cytochrome/quinol oxidase subunit 2
VLKVMALQLSGRPEAPSLPVGPDRGSPTEAYEDASLRFLLLTMHTAQIRVCVVVVVVVVIFVVTAGGCAGARRMKVRISPNTSLQAALRR